MRETFEFLYAFGAAAMLSICMKIESERGFRRCVPTFAAMILMSVLWPVSLVLTAMLHWDSIKLHWQTKKEGMADDSAR